MMTKEEALNYIFAILLYYFTLSHDDEAGILLGDLDPTYILNKKAKTADPAAWYDWLDAIQKITPNELLTEAEARKAIIALMNEYNAHHGFNLKKAIRYFNSEDNFQ